MSKWLTVEVYRVKFVDRIRRAGQVMSCVQFNDETKAVAVFWKYDKHKKSIRVSWNRKTGKIAKSRELVQFLTDTMGLTLSGEEKDLMEVMKLFVDSGIYLVSQDVEFTSQNWKEELSSRGMGFYD